MASPWLGIQNLPVSEDVASSIAFKALEEKRKKEALEKLKEAQAVDAYAASLQSSDMPPTGAEDYKGSSAKASINEYLDSPETRAYLADLEKSQQEAIANQKMGVESAQSNLNAFSNLPVQYDLSPLMNLSDSWFGSNLLKGYKSPTSPQELIATRSALEGALAKTRSGVTEAEKDRLQQNLTNRQKTAQLLNDAAIADLKRKELGAADRDRQSFKDEKMKMEMLAKFNKDYGEHIRGVSQMRVAVQDALSILDKTGGKIPEYGSEDYNQYQSEITKVLVNYNRDVAMLGALSGPDKVLLDQIASNDENVAKRAFKEFAFKKDIRGVLKKLASDADTKVSNLKPQTDPYKKYIPDVYDASFGAYEAAKKGSPPQAKTQKLSDEDKAAIEKGLK